MGLIKEAVYGGLWTALIRYGFFVVNFSANLWLARLLLPEHFGVFALSLSLVELVFILAGFGIWLACVHLKDEPDVFDTCFIISLCLSVTIFLISLCVAAVASKFYEEQIITFMVVIAGLKSLVMLSAVPMAVIEVEHRFKLSAFISGIGRPIGILIAVVMAYDGFEAWSLLAREVVAISSLFLLPLFLSPYRIGLRFSRSTATKIIRYSTGVFFQRTTETLFLRLPVFLLGSMGGSVIGGYYDRSLYLSTISNSFLAQMYNRLGVVIFSKVKDDPAKIAFGVDWNIFFIVRLSFIVALAVGLFPELVLTTLLGEQWYEGADFFRGFAVFIAFYPIVEVVKSALLALGITWLITVPRILAIAIVCSAVVAGSQIGRWEVVSWAMSFGMLIAFVAATVGGRFYGMALNIVTTTWLPLIMVTALSIGILRSGLEETWIGLSICLIAWVLAILLVDSSKLVVFYRMVRK